MGDTDSGADADKGAGNEGEGAETSDEKKDGEDGSDSGDGGDDADDKSGKDDAKKEDDKKTDDTKDDDAEPPTRKRSKESFILDRKNRQLAKASKGKGDEGGGGDDKGEDGDDAEDDVDPEDRDIISKEVNKILKPVIEKQEADALKQEVSDFLADPKNAIFKPYQDKILKFASHDSRKHLPLSTIAYEVAGPELLRIGAEQGREADKKAKDTRAGGGGSNAGAETKSGNLEMSVEDFKKKQDEVLRKPRN